MNATNCIGYQIEVYHHASGWRMESDGYATMEEAREAMQALPFDGLERRVYESLEGYETA